MICRTSDLVKEILKSDIETRSSDNVLYLRVLQSIAKSRNIDINNMSVPHLFMNMHKLELPAFETVRRARQKLQECHPELKATDVVEGYRMVLEEEYRGYARRVSV